VRHEHLLPNDKDSCFGYATHESLSLGGKSAEEFSSAGFQTVTHANEKAVYEAFLG
jgi:hypothetical protein